jgi:type I restriction enzyme, S subunit
MTNLEREAAELTETSFSRRKPYPEYKNSGVEWLSEIPTHWDTKRLKYIVTELNNQKSVLIGDESYLPLENIESWTGKYTLSELPDTFEGAAKIFQPGDVLFNKLRPYLAKVVLSKDQGICVGELLVLRINRANVIPEFLFWRLISPEIIKTVDGSTYGTKMPRANWSFIGNLPIPYPTDVKEQCAIATFLDRETTKLDALIIKKRELITLLQEQRRVIINHAVTKGLNPDTPLKDSGIEWLGKIPAHWKIIRSKRLFYVRNERARDDDQQLSATQAYGVIPQEEYEQRVGRQVVKIIKNLEQRSHVEQDDFVISMRSFQGGLERAWVRGCIRSSYVVLKPTFSVDIDFFMYLFKSASYIQALQATADFIRDGQDLTFRNFSLVDLPLIPIDEQRAIAIFLSELCCKT